jgi:hypothetical protein
MHVAKLLGDLGIGVHVEIIKASLPEALWSLRMAPKFPLVAISRSSLVQETAGDSLFQNLHDDRGIVPCRLADEKVDMLRHYDESHDVEAIALANLLQYLEEDVARLRCSQKGFTPVTTGCDEMKIASTIKAPQRIAFRYQHGAAL